MSVKVTDNTDKVLNRMRQANRVFVRMAAEEVVKVARPITPKKDGNLRSDINITVAGLSGINIVWNKVYAQYQERGMRKDGSHVVKKYTTGGTGKGFAEKSVKRVVDKTAEINLKATRLM